MAGRGYGIKALQAGGVAGLDGLIARLRVLPETAARGCEYGLQFAAEAITAQAQMRAYELASPITNTVRCDGLRTEAVVEAEPGGPVPEWPVFVEMGTGPHGIESGGEKYPLPSSAYTQQPWVYRDANGQFHTTSGRYAHPYLWPAYCAEEPYILDHIRTGIEMAKAEEGAV